MLRLGLNLGLTKAIGGFKPASILINNGVISDKFTFTRASEQTYTDASGVIQTAAVNAPAPDKRGFALFEDQTNLVTQDTITIFNESLASLTSGQEDPSLGSGAYLVNEGTATFYHA